MWSWSLSSLIGEAIALCRRPWPFHIHPQKFSKSLDRKHTRAHLAGMELKTLDLFVAVARRLSFAAVAKDRGVDPSSVSRAVGELEAELGLRLFQRTTRTMTLTEAGEVYLARIEPLVEEATGARDLAAQVVGKPRGTLRISASVTFGQKRIVPLLSAFRALNPEIKVDCLFTDANVDLVADRIDLAVRLAPSVEGDLIAAKLMDTRYRVVASPRYLAGHAPLVKPADLASHRVLLFNLRAYRSRWLFREPSGAIVTVPIEGDITLSPAGSLLDAALLGLGPALLPDWLVEESITEGTLIDLFPERHATATTFDTAAWLVYPSRAFLPGKVRAMADFLRGHLARS
jgi:DNA-binding transcriptional LysR family regulator